MRIQRFSWLTLDSASFSVEFAKSLQAHLQVLARILHSTTSRLCRRSLAPVLRMRGTLLGKGRCGLALLLYWACTGPQLSRYTAAPCNFPRTHGDAGEGHGCCAPTCILWNQGDTLSSSLVVNTAAGFWFKYLIAPSVFLLLGRKAMTNLDSILKSRDIICQQKSVWSKLWFFQ